jgi:hypothetical protein
MIMQTIEFHLLDGRGVYQQTMQIDPMGPLPGRGTLINPPEAEEGKTRMLIGDAWQQVPDADVPPVQSTMPPIAARQAAAWERIKAERDRRKFAGVKVGAHWFHSDDSSRIQQLALAMMGASMPAGLQWKTLTLSPQTVFVTMTQSIAAGIFQATAASDTAVFAAAEAHRLAMEASDRPDLYDISSGWPATIYDEVSQ